MVNLLIYKKARRKKKSLNWNQDEVVCYNNNKTGDSKGVLLREADEGMGATKISDQEFKVKIFGARVVQWGERKRLLTKSYV